MKFIKLEPGMKKKGEKIDKNSLSSYWEKGGKNGRVAKMKGGTREKGLIFGSVFTRQDLDDKWMKIFGAKFSHACTLEHQ